MENNVMQEMRVYDGYLVGIMQNLPENGPEIIPATSYACVGFSLKEERVMQQSRDKYFPQLRTKVSILVGDTRKSPIYAPAQTIKHLQPKW